MKITTPGNSEITLIPGRDYAVYVAGNFATGTLTLSIGNADLSGILPVPGYGSLTGDATFVLTAPSHRLLVSFSGPSNPNLSVDCVLCPSGS